MNHGNGPFCAHCLLDGTHNKEVIRLAPTDEWVCGPHATEYWQGLLRYAGAQAVLDRLVNEQIEQDFDTRGPEILSLLANTPPSPGNPQLVGSLHTLIA